MIQSESGNNTVSCAVITLYTTLHSVCAWLHTCQRRSCYYATAKKGFLSRVGVFFSDTDKLTQDCSCTVSFVQTSQLHQLCSKTLMWQAQELYVCPVKVLMCTSGWRALFPNSSMIGIHMQTCWIPGDIITAMSRGLNSVLWLRLLEFKEEMT